MSAWGVIVSAYTGASLVEILSEGTDDGGPFVECQSRSGGPHSRFKASPEDVERFASRDEAESRFAVLHLAEMAARDYL